MDRKELKQDLQGFEIVITGSGAPGSVLERANPSTLVRFRDRYFLVDCGYGTCVNLEKMGIPEGRIKNVIITHQHEDHTADILHLLMAGWYDVREGRKSLTLIGPQVQTMYDCAIAMNRDDIDGRIAIGRKQASMVNARMANGAGNPGSPAEMQGKFPPRNMPKPPEPISEKGILDAVEIHDLTESDCSFEVDGVNLSLHKVLHGNMQSYSVKFRADGKTVLVTGDVAYTKDLEAFYKGADVMVLEALLLSGMFAKMPGGLGTDAHMTKDQIGMILSKTQPKTVVLTHAKGLFPDQEEVIRYFRECGYQGEVLFAYDGLCVEA